MKNYAHNSKSAPNNLAKRMGLSLLYAVIAGSLFMFLRDYLISNGNNSTWAIINNILFQDITTEQSSNALGLFYILGQIFINSLQLIIIPMVFSSIALAMCHISDTKKLGRISFKTLLGFLVTSIFSLIIACIFGFTSYRLGFFNVNLNENIVTSINTATSNNPLLILINAVPNNITSVLSNNSMVLSIVFLAVVTGLCINKLNDRILVIKNLLIDINNIIEVFLTFIIDKFSPIAVFVLITRTFAVYGIEFLKPALSYLGTVAIATILFFFLGYPTYIYVTTRLNPLIFIKKISKVALLAFSAASSAAALSLNEKTTSEELGVDSDISSFILPLGMTINMNGTAIMQVIGTIFIASTAGYSLNISNIILIALLALMASIGTPSAPGSSTIVLFTVLSGMGYSNEATLIAYSLIIAINRPMDMLTTCLNVAGDSATAIVVAKSENSLDVDTYYS